MLSLAACGGVSSSEVSEAKATPSSSESSAESEVSESSDESESEENTQIANPFVDCETLDDAAAIAGFTLELPEALDAQGERSIQAIESEMISVYYEADGEYTAVARKGADETDVSGDYSTYENETTAEVDGVTVTLRGNGELYSLATWVRDGHAFSLSISAGADEQTFTELIAGIR